MNAAENYNINE